MRHADYMALAIEQARQAAHLGEVPVGAVLLDRDSRQIIAQAHNRCLQDGDETAHAELLVLQSAAKEQELRHLNLVLYVTLEPCPMCAGAILHNRLNQVVYGADDPILGAAGSKASILGNTSIAPQPEIIAGVLAPESQALLKSFFKELR
jgi:tRNA(adenine34) deaminase